MHICEITSDRKFVLEMDVCLKVAVSLLLNTKDIEGAPIGTIAIDSIYSLVVRVAFDVAPARLGKRTDFEN